MTLIKTNIENLHEDKKTLYMLTKKSGKKISDLAPDQMEMSWPVDAYILYSDVNSDGEEIEYLKILSGNVVLSTTSESVKRGFLDVVDIMGDEPFSVVFDEKVSKNNRHYFICEMAID